MTNIEKDRLREVCDIICRAGRIDKDEAEWIAICLASFGCVNGIKRNTFCVQKDESVYDK